MTRCEINVIIIGILSLAVAIISPRFLVRHWQDDHSSTLPTLSHLFSEGGSYSRGVGLQKLSHVHVKWMPLTIRNHFIHPIAFIFSFPPVSLCLIIHICKVYIFSFHVAPFCSRIFPLFCHHIYHFHFLTFFFFNSHWVWLAPRAPTSHIFSSSPKMVQPTFCPDEAVQRGGFAHSLTVRRPTKIGVGQKLEIYTAPRTFCSCWPKMIK